MNERFIDFYLTISNEKSCLIYEYDFVIYEIFDFRRLIFESEYVFSFENLLSHKKSVLSDTIFAFHTRLLFQLYILSSGIFTKYFGKLCIFN